MGLFAKTRRSCQGKAHIIKAHLKSLIHRLHTRHLGFKEKLGEMKLNDLRRQKIQRYNSCHKPKRIQIAMFYTPGL